MSCADINAQGNNCRPNRIASGDLPAGRQSIAEWFNTAAFVIPSPQAYGNAGRNILFGPGAQNFDLGVSRVVSLGGNRKPAGCRFARNFQRAEPHQFRSCR